MHMRPEANAKRFLIAALKKIDAMSVKRLSTELEGETPMLFSVVDTPDSSFYVSIDPLLDEKRDSLGTNFNTLSEVKSKVLHNDQGIKEQRNALEASLEGKGFVVDHMYISEDGDLEVPVSRLG